MEECLAYSLKTITAVSKWQSALLKAQMYHLFCLVWLNNLKTQSYGFTGGTWAAGGCLGFLLNLGNLYSLAVSANPTKDRLGVLFKLVTTHHSH